VKVMAKMDIAERRIPQDGRATIKVGDSEVFERSEYRKWLALTILLIEMFLLYAFIRSDVGSRMFRKSGKRRDQSAPEPMV